MTTGSTLVLALAFGAAASCTSLPRREATAAPVEAPVEPIPATCLLVLPEGTPPEGGWPTFLLLHGFGTNKSDFADLAAVVSRRGAAAIAVDAPEDLGNGRRSWSGEIAATHTYLQEQLAAFRDDPRLDLTPLHVGGFSQGGIRSLLLAAHHPDVYGGVLSVSPAGGSWPEAPSATRHGHPLRLVYGTGEQEQILTSASRALAFWQAWGQPFEVFTHPGGHHFPGDWVTVLGDGVTWILDPTIRP